MVIKLNENDLIVSDDWPVKLIFGSFEDKPHWGYDLFIDLVSDISKDRACERYTQLYKEARESLEESFKAYRERFLDK